MSAAASPPRAAPAVRRGLSWSALFWQGFALAAIAWLGWMAASNAIENMQARNIPTNFDFWHATAGFDINQSVIAYSSTSTYGRAFFVGLINTLIVAFIGIVLASLLGFSIGVARLSQNWLTARLAAGYVEIIRNTPLLLQLLFWYNAVLKPLPGPRQSLTAPAVALQAPDTRSAAIAIVCAIVAILSFYAARKGIARGAMRLVALAATSILGFCALAIGLFGIPETKLSSASHGLIALSQGSSLFLNNRGLYLPDPVPAAGFLPMVIALIVCAAGAFLFYMFARRRQAETGKILPVAQLASGGAVLVIAFIWAVSGPPVSLEYAQLRGFNFTGGLRVYPEFVALVLGLVIYTAAFIAEIVRAGILAVSKGQSEAALALGLRQSCVLKLVVIPQALRVIIPPLTNQYLNLTKNSSLAVFIGFPDLVQIFAGTVLNQTGAAVQVIAITMAVYLVISLATSLIMNIYNRRMALVER